MRSGSSEDLRVRELSKRGAPGLPHCQPLRRACAMILCAWLRTPTARTCGDRPFSRNVVDAHGAAQFAPRSPARCRGRAPPMLFEAGRVFGVSRPDEPAGREGLARAGLLIAPPARADGITRRRRSKGRPWIGSLWRWIKGGRPAAVTRFQGNPELVGGSCAPPHRRRAGSYSGRHETPSYASSSMSTVLNIRFALGEIPEISPVREMVFSS